MNIEILNSKHVWMCVTFIYQFMSLCYFILFVFQCRGLHMSGTFQKAFLSRLGWLNIWTRFLLLWFCSLTWTGMIPCGRSGRWNVLPELKSCGKYCCLLFSTTVIIHIFCIMIRTKARSSAVAERPCDVLCQSAFLSSGAQIQYKKAIEEWPSIFNVIMVAAIR